MKVRVNNTTLSNVFNTAPEDKKINYRKSNSYVNTYKLGDSATNQNQKVRVTDNLNSSLFMNQAQQSKVRENNTHKSHLFEEKYKTEEFKKNDFTEKKSEYEGKSPAFKRRLVEVYGREGNIEQQQLSTKKNESKTNHQRKIEDHYMNDVIGEQKKTECDDQNHQKYKDYMEFNNNDRYVNPSD